MGKKTPLYDMHVAMDGKIVDFGGWDMPLHYGSQIEEHHAVRRGAGMFDVSHMTIVDLEGAQVRSFLRYLMANNVDRLKQPGKALYTCMLNERGGVIDDLIVYFMTEQWFRLVVNAATHDKDLAWLDLHAPAFQVRVTERQDLAMIAVQGPHARDAVHTVLGTEIKNALTTLPPFNAMYMDVQVLREAGSREQPMYMDVQVPREAGGREQSPQVSDIFIARTGYTGEDGYEVILPASQAADFWQRLHAAGVKPIGLGARDTLRLEAGMNLYGADMDENITPLECGLDWTIAWEPAERDFIGRTALETQRKNGVPRKLVGLILNDKGVLRNHQHVIVEGRVCGEITSGSFSPTLGQAIAFARVSTEAVGTNADNGCEIDMRGRLVSATVVKPPFARHGKSCLEAPSGA